MPARQCHSIRGITLIELVLYAGLLIVMLSVFYELFAVAGFQKLSQIIEQELYQSGQHALFEIQNSVEQASIITAPALGASGDTLSLDGGATTISVTSGRIVKTVGGVSAPITSDRVIVDSLTFETVGPSTESPTVSVVIELRGGREIDGRTRTETFRSSTTLR